MCWLRFTMEFILTYMRESLGYAPKNINYSRLFDFLKNIQTQSKFIRIFIKVIVLFFNIELLIPFMVTQYN